MNLRMTAAAAALAISGSLIGAGPASAGSLCDDYGICGDVYNDGTSVSWIRIVTNWGCYTSCYKIAYPGQGSNTLNIRDADGYYIPSGCYGVIYKGDSYVPSGWYKITDNQDIRLFVRDAGSCGR